MILIILLYYYFNNKEYFTNNICNSKLKDIEYLKHMIPHHQVAVDISEILLKTTKSPIMHDILRKLIWTQKYEILLMNNIKNKLPYVTDQNAKMTSHYVSSVSDFIYPNKIKLSNVYCDPHFFDPKKHSEHLKHMVINEKSYIEHMIPHHQVAIVMSNRLLKHTNNTHMIRICYEIITSQRSEILKMNYILEYMNNKKIDFLPNYY